MTVTRTHRLQSIGGRLAGVTDVLPHRPPTPADRVGECCTPLAPPAAALLKPDLAEQLARRFKALADPTRVRLLSLIGSHPAGEACVCDLTAPIGLSQGTVSFHLKTLVDAGLLTREQRGRWSFYRLIDGALDDLADILRRF